MREHLWSWLLLMEVPMQRCPEHHGYLAGGARGGSEIGGRRIRDGGYEEMVVPQAW